MEHRKSVKSIDSFNASKYRNNLIRKSDGIKVVKKHKIVDNKAFDKQINKNKHSIDSLVSRNLDKKEGNKNLYTETKNTKKGKKEILSLNMWKFSLLGVMFFSVITVSFIYKNLGQTAKASDDTMNIEETDLLKNDAEIGQYEGVSVDKYEEEDKSKKDIKYGKLPLPDDDKSEEQLAFEKRAKEIVKGYPIEKMLPYIFKQDLDVAVYLIAISKQESAWGKRKPVLNGKECYNYWGYRGKREKMGSGGHTCFNSRKDAVETVGKRIHDLVYKYDRKTPDKMIVWKCGSSCEGHSSEGVDRWIKTIKTYRDDLLGK